MRPELRKVCRSMDAYLNENCTYHVTPCEGVPEMLYKLKKQGVKLAVLSNKPHCQAVKAVHAIYGEKLFDWVQGQKDEIPRKPDPAGSVLCGEKARCRLQGVSVCRRF